MALKKCPRCGKAVAIRTEKKGNVYAIRATCPNCGKRGKAAIDKRNPAAGAASEYWAGMNWNCGLYEQEGKA